MFFHDYISLIVAFVCAFLISLSTTPMVRVLAYKIGAIDIPKDKRRIHKAPTPLIGGLAIFLAFLITTLVFCEIDAQISGLLLGTVIIAITGVIDDKFSMNPLVKLGMQILCGIIAWFMGIRIDHINIFGSYILFGSFSIIVTVFWIVALTNAVNLIDGLDGLSCGVSTISAVCMLISSFFLADTSVTVILMIAILAGSCAGFLPYNFNPAKIFMGDTGALFLGYVLACLSIMGFFKVTAVVSFWVPFLAFALPLTDTFVAFVRRIIKGHNPFRADRGHIHHKLIDAGFNQKQTVMILYAVSAIMGISAIVFAMDKPIQGSVVLIIAIVLAIVNWRLIKSNDETRNETGLGISPSLPATKEKSEQTTEKEQ